MSNISINVDDVVESTFVASDFKPRRAILREDTWFEMNVAAATVALANKGYLQLALQLEVLDANGKKMGTVLENVALPVSFKGMAPHWDSAKTMYLQKVRPLLLEHSAYDTVGENAATGKKEYKKNGNVIGQAEFAAAHPEPALPRALSA